VKGAFSRGAAATDAIMILRMLANHYMKNPVGDSVLNFLENIWREIAMKSGALGADLAARDALVHRFLV
jgi:hypothetical protein